LIVPHARNERARTQRGLSLFMVNRGANMKILILLGLAFSLSPVRLLAIEVDSTWPLPDPLPLRFTIFGTFHYYYDDVGGPNPSRDTIYYGRQSQIAPCIEFNSSNKLVHHTFDGELFHVVYSDTGTGFLDRRCQTTFDATLDTIHHRILSLRFSTSDRSMVSQNNAALIVLNDLNYSQNSISFPDSNFIHHVDSISYAWWSAPAFEYDESEALVKLQWIEAFGVQLNVSGVRERHLELSPAKVISLPGGFMLYPSEGLYASSVEVYSTAGLKIKEQQLAYGQTVIQFDGLPIGVYLVRFGSLIAKAIVLEE
jgi:hypothetical protein